MINIKHLLCFHAYKQLPETKVFSHTDIADDGYGWEQTIEVNFMQHECIKCGKKKWKKDIEVIPTNQR